MRFLFWKSFFGLFAYDLLFLGGSFSRLHRIVRNWKVSEREPAPETADRVCDAMNRACVWYPKRAPCLQRSSVTTCLLRSCGVSAQMVIGAQKFPFKAHAWVEVSANPINERIDVRAIYGVWERC